METKLNSIGLNLDHATFAALSKDTVLRLWTISQADRLLDPQVKKAMNLRERAFNMLKIAMGLDNDGRRIRMLYQASALHAAARNLAEYQLPLVSSAEATAARDELTQYLWRYPVAVVLKNSREVNDDLNAALSAAGEGLLEALSTYNPKFGVSLDAWTVTVTHATINRKGLELAAEGTATSPEMQKIVRKVRKARKTLSNPDWVPSLSNAERQEISRQNTTARTEGGVMLNWHFTRQLRPLKSLLQYGHHRMVKTVLRYGHHRTDVTVIGDAATPFHPAWLHSLRGEKLREYVEAGVQHTVYRPFRTVEHRDLHATLVAEHTLIIERLAGMTEMQISERRLREARKVLQGIEDGSGASRLIAVAGRITLDLLNKQATETGRYDLTDDELMASQIYQALGNERYSYEQILEATRFMRDGQYTISLDSLAEGACPEIDPYGDDWAARQPNAFAARVNARPDMQFLEDARQANEWGMLAPFLKDELNRNANDTEVECVMCALEEHFGILTSSGHSRQDTAHGVVWATHAPEQSDRYDPGNPQTWWPQAARARRVSPALGHTLETLDVSEELLIQAEELLVNQEELGMDEQEKLDMDERRELAALAS